MEHPPIGRPAHSPVASAARKVIPRCGRCKNRANLVLPPGRRCIEPDQSEWLPMAHWAGPSGIFVQHPVESPSVAETQPVILGSRFHVCRSRRANDEICPRSRDLDDPGVRKPAQQMDRLLQRRSRRPKECLHGRRERHHEGAEEASVLRPTCDDGSLPDRRRCVGRARDGRGAKSVSADAEYGDSAAPKQIPNSARPAGPVRRRTPTRRSPPNIGEMASRRWSRIKSTARFRWL